MKKTTPLIAAILGAVLLVLQQYIGEPTIDWKMLGFAVLVAVVGVVSMSLKGKGATFWGVIGTVGFNLYQIWQSGHFTWNEFVLSSLILVITLFAPSTIPEVDDSK